MKGSAGRGSKGSASQPAPGKKQQTTPSMRKSSSSSSSSSADLPRSSSSSSAGEKATSRKTKKPLRADGSSGSLGNRSPAAPSSMRASPMQTPFVFSPSTSFHASPSSSGRGSARASPSSGAASPASSPFAPTAASPYAKRGGGTPGSAGAGRGRGGFSGAGDAGGAGRGRGAGGSPYKPYGGHKTLNSSGGGARHYSRRERTLNHWSDAINYDKVKRVINVYLNDFQLKDRDLERFIEWFESGESGGRRTLTWLLERHAKGWDESSDDTDKAAEKNEAADRTKNENDIAEAQAAEGDAPELSTKPPGMNWHLQENQITDEGVKALIAFATRIQSKVELRRFYLYKNIIGDDGAAAIASFVKNSPTFIYEIHLSHNRLTIKGAEDLFMAMKQTRVKPPRPLWLRLEWNYISFAKAKKVLKDNDISFCRVKDRQHCAPSKCSTKPPPLLHLYVAELQYSESVGTSSRLQLAKERVKQAKEALETVQRKDDSMLLSHSNERNQTASASTPTPSHQSLIRKDLDQTKPVATTHSNTKEEGVKPTAATPTPQKLDQTASAEPITTGAEAESEALLKDVPTYIFLDTCAVLRMSESRKGFKNIEAEMGQYVEEDSFEDIDLDENDEETAAEEVMKVIQKKISAVNQTKKQKNATPIKPTKPMIKKQVNNGGRDAQRSVQDHPEFPVFTFESLVERAKKRKFGENLTQPGDQVTLVITDTVMRELDHLKSSKPALIRNILSLQSDDGYLAKGVHLKFIEMLGAHQGEHLVALQDSSIVQSYGRKVMKATSSLDNDRKIIDVALFWNSEIGVTGNVILLTADEGVREAAKRHNLPADLWKNLNKRLFNALKGNPSVPWTASLLKSCMPGCMVKRDGKTMHLTPSVKPVQNIFQELDSALVLTYLLMEKVKSLQIDNQRLKQMKLDNTTSRTGVEVLSQSSQGETDEPGTLTGLKDGNEDESEVTEETERLLQETRERRRMWLEMLGQMAGPLSPMRMKSAEQILYRVKQSTRGSSDADLSGIMKTLEFLEVEGDDTEPSEDEDAAASDSVNTADAPISPREEDTVDEDEEEAEQVDNGNEEEHEKEREEEGREEHGDDDVETSAAQEEEAAVAGEEQPSADQDDTESSFATSQEAQPTPASDEETTGPGAVSASSSSSSPSSPSSSSADAGASVPASTEP